jgi:DNA-binding MarR family transcriptional regulator
MVLLYSNKVCELTERSNGDELEGSISYLKGKEKELLILLMKKYKREFTPIEVSKELKITNKTVINRLASLVKNGFVIPHMVKERIRSYELSDFTKQNEKEIIKLLE